MDITNGKYFFVWIDKECAWELIRNFRIIHVLST